MSSQVQLAKAELEQDDTYDTSDKEAVNKVRKKSARTRVNRLEFVAAAMTTEQGRAWFYDLLLFCKVFQGPYADDPYRAYFLMGEQNIGLKVLSDIQESSPDNYLKMISENKTRTNG